MYVDDCLVISHRGMSILRNEIGVHFKLKEESVGEHKLYLGGKIIKKAYETKEGIKDLWSFSSSQYIQNACKNVKQYLKNETRPGFKVTKKDNRSPISSGYRPELDETEELSPEDASHYHSLIGVLRWIVELGRVDIITEVSMLSSCLALPRFGHLLEVFNIFAYLDVYHNTEMVLDSTTPDVDVERDFLKEDWSTSVYLDEDGSVPSEVIPEDAPVPKGKGMMMTLFVNSDHAGDKVTSRSRTGYVVFLQNSPITWFSKKQSSVETSTFGSKFMAMKTATEYIRGLRYKLRMMGIPIIGPCLTYGDNNAVVTNSTLPDSVLKKKSNSIAYNFVREGAARDEWRCRYIPTDENLSDLCTKPLAFGEKRIKFCQKLLHHIYKSGKHLARGATRVLGGI